MCHFDRVLVYLLLKIIQKAFLSSLFLINFMYSWLCVEYIWMEKFTTEKCRHFHQFVKSKLTQNHLQLADMFPKDFHCKHLSVNTFFCLFLIVTLLKRQLDCLNESQPYNQTSNASISLFPCLTECIVMNSFLTDHSSFSPLSWCSC